MRQIEPVQSLRALAATMVVVGHAQTEAAVAAAKHGLAFTRPGLLPWGAGVDLFFVISGFIMVVASDKLFAASGGGATFVTRRLKRIVPLYWLATSLYVLIQLATHKHVDGLDLVASYLFWPRDVYGDGVLRPIYALGWTLDYEMVFYALFGAVIVLPRRRCVTAVTALLAAGVALNLAVALPAPLMFWTQPIVLEFALGMGIGLAWCEGIRLGLPIRIALAAGGLTWLGADVLDAAHRGIDWITPTDLARLGAWGLPAAFLVAAGALGTPRSDAPRSFLGTIALGDASYALYLVHPFVIGVLMRLWTASGVAPHIGYWPFVTIAVVASIGVAFLVHRRIERPLGRALALKRIDDTPILAPTP